MMKIKIGISPCPNDTFIFDALLHKKIDTQGFTFEYILEDIDTLNRLSTQGSLDIIKISYAHYFRVQQQYDLLPSGGALGQGVGPLLVSRTPIHKITDSLSVAIPGQYTTANFLLEYVYPQLSQKQVMVFSDIENGVLSGKTDLGVLIHENRFTYQARGLYLVSDLGTMWEQKTQLPIPLGGIIIKKNIQESIKKNIHLLIQKSIQFAWEQYPMLSHFTKQHAQTMQTEVMHNHIQLYVNAYSIDFGEKGKQAIQLMSEILSKHAL